MGESASIIWVIYTARQRILSLPLQGFSLHHLYCFSTILISLSSSSLNFLSWFCLLHKLDHRESEEEIEGEERERERDRSKEKLLLPESVQNWALQIFSWPLLQKNFHRQISKEEEEEEESKIWMRGSNLGLTFSIPLLGSNLPLITHHLLDLLLLLPLIGKGLFLFFVDFICLWFDHVLNLNCVLVVMLLSCGFERFWLWFGCWCIAADQVFEQVSSSSELNFFHSFWLF